MSHITRSEKNRKKQQEITNEKIKKKSSFIIRFLTILALCIFLIIIYCRYTETSGLIVNEYKVTSEELPEQFHGIKIVHFSDIHYGTTVDITYLQSIVKRINELKPDLVIFTGDLIFKNYQVNNDTIKQITKELNNIHATISKYACMGNEDYDNEQFSIILKNSGFKVLNNSYEKIYYQNKEYILINGIGSEIEKDSDIEKAFSFNEKDKFVITITHENSLTKEILEYSPNLILSGHSLGGQIRIPMLGGIIKEENADTYNKRHEKKEETELFNSYGIGTSQIRFRFLNKPSINLYRLTKNKDN